MQDMTTKDLMSSYFLENE